METETGNCFDKSCLWPGSNERGSALLMTLGVLLLMLIIGLGFMFSARIERDIASNQADATRAEFTSESGLQRGLAILEKAAPQNANESFAPLQMQNLFITPTDSTRINKGYYSLSDSDIDLVILNRTGKLDPNWFGQPTHYLTNASGTWRFSPCGSLATGTSPIGMLFTRPDGVPLTPKERNKLFVADPTLRWALLPSAPPPAFDQMSAGEYDTFLTNATFSSFAELNQRWINRDQIFRAAGWLNTLPDYGDINNSKINQDFLFPHSPNPIAFKSLDASPDPLGAGANTFIDWHEDLSSGIGWRSMTLLQTQPPTAPMPEDYNVKLRLPIDGFRYLAITPSATPAETDVIFDDLAGGSLIDSAFQGRKLIDCLPWFRMQYQRRAIDNADPASYYELVANVKDFVTPGEVPSNNLWPRANPALTYFCNALTAAGPLSNPLDSGVHPYCGTKPRPAIAEIKLDFNSASGLSSAQVELVNFHFEQCFDTDLNDLAVVLEVEWDDNGTLHQQKAVVGFATTAAPIATKPLTVPAAPVAGYIGSLNTSVNFSKLAPTSPISTTKAKIARVRAYLVKGTGMGELVENNLVTAAVLGNLALLDAAVLDIPARSQLLQTVAGTTPLFADGVVLTVKPIDFVGTLSTGDLFVCASDGKVYVAAAPGLATDLLASNQCYLLSPQPSPAASGGQVFNLPATPGANGALYYTGAMSGNIYASGTGGSLLGTVTSTPASVNTKTIYLEARDPRNNTRWTYGDNDVWTLGFDGSMGKANLDWWESIPAAVAWEAGKAVAVGDRILYPATNGKEYEVLLAHTTDAALAPDLPAAATYFRPVWRRAATCGRNVWLAGNAGEDAVAYPGAASLAAAGFATVDDVVTYCLRPSTAFVRSGQPQSLWELGAINRAEPWRTIRLAAGRRDPDPAGSVRLGDYAMGDWMLLDEVSLFTNNTTPSSGNAYATECGKVNPNPDIVTAPGLTQLLMVLGSTRTISPAGRDATTPRDAYNNSAAVPCQLVSDDLFDTAFFSYDYNDTTGLNELFPIVSRGELATRRNASDAFPMIDWWNDSLADLDVANRPTLSLDRNQEELIGKTANLLQTRYQYFEIQTTGRYRRGTENQKTTATRQLRATIERDAYLGKLRIVNAEHPDD